MNYYNGNHDTVDHYASRRVPLQLNALIYKHGTPVATGRIINGSRHGLYLETEYQDVRELQRLELEVLLAGRIKGEQRCRVGALVVKKTLMGKGLEMELLEEPGNQLLHDLIQKEQGIAKPIAS